MNKKEQLKRLICTLYRQGEPEDYTDECMEDMLDNIDFEMLLQAVAHSAKTVYAYGRIGCLEETTKKRIRYVECKITRISPCERALSILTTHTARHESKLPLNTFRFISVVSSNATNAPNLVSCNDSTCIGYYACASAVLFLEPCFSVGCRSPPYPFRFIRFKKSE